VVVRLFVASWPSAAVVDTLRTLERPDIGGVRWTSESQWHVTVRFLGSVEDSEVPAVVDALRVGLAGAAGGEALLGPETACFGRGVLMVPVSGHDALAAAVTRATASFGEPPDPRPFHGHLTLARSGGGRGRGRGADLRQLAGRPVAGSWSVSELTLVRSHTEPSRVRYEVLERFSLVD
jgi:2'-5' RNA ligase